MHFCPTAHHEWLLSDAVDILPYLLLPLAGPEELSEEENEGDALQIRFKPYRSKYFISCLLVETKKLKSPLTAVATLSLVQEMALFTHFDVYRISNYMCKENGMNSGNIAITAGSCEFAKLES